MRDIDDPGLRRFTGDSISEYLDIIERPSGRNILYVHAEASRDMPVYLEHYYDGVLQWARTMSSTGFRIWRARGFK